MVSNLWSICVGAVIAVCLGGSPLWAQSLTLETVSTDVLGFGYGSTVGVSGDYAVVGDRDGFVSGVRRGRATVFQRQGTAWVAVANLVASDGAASDRFGFAVAIKGDTVVVSADYGNGQRGAAYVFERTGTTWSQTQRLVASNAAVNDRFGGAVSVDTGVIVVGAPAKFSEIGVTYVFERNGTAWTERQITNPNIQDGFFGQGADLSGNTLCLSAAAGSNHFFIRGASDWVLQQTVQNPGAARGTCRIDGNTAVVGGDSGTFIYVRSGTTWSLQQELTVTSPVPGTSNVTDVSGNFALLGMKGSSTVAGAVYMFTRTGTSWALTRTVSDAGPNAQFGTAVAIDTDNAVIGASFSAYFYRRSAGGGSGAPGAPTNFQANVSGNTVSLSWGAPASGGVPTSYALQVVGGPSYPMGVATSFTSPAPNGVYALRVVAANASGTGPASNTVQVTVPATVAPPGPPANLTAAVAGSTVSFGWAPPTSGGTVAGYTLQAGTTAGFVTPFASLPLPASATTLSVPGVPASTYYVRLVAQNAGGPGVASNEVTFTVAGPAPPSAPILNAPSVVGRTVTLSWSAGSGGGSPTSYVLSVTGALATTVPLTGTSISVPGVPSGTYQLRLTAVNSVGPSQPSAQVTLIVP